jgi:hypothetical protein
MRLNRGQHGIDREEDPNGHRHRTQTFGTEAASYAKQQFSHFADDLSARERAILQRVRAFMETKVQPSRCST